MITNRIHQSANKALGINKGKQNQKIIYWWKNQLERPKANKQERYYSCFNIRNLENKNKYKEQVKKFKTEVQEGKM